jgi:YHS domain-containing protein
MRTELRSIERRRHDAALRGGVPPVCRVVSADGCIADASLIAEMREPEPKMEKDVVCGMQVDPAKAAGNSQYGGKTYYFCSKGCKAKFNANPGQFAK